MWWTGVLWMSGIALALGMAGVGYRTGKVAGKSVFVLGVGAAVALLALAVTACTVPSDSAPSERPDPTVASPSAKIDSGQGAANIQKMLQEYKVNPLRAEHLYEGETMVVGGVIASIKEDMVGNSVTILPGDDPNKGYLPRVWLKSGVSLLFASNDARSWLIEKDVGDSIEAECHYRRYGGSSSMDGPLALVECQQVPG